MGVNNSNLALSFADASTLMNNVIKQATGEDVAAQIASGDFVSVATTALRSGYDPLMTAISQVVGKTIFSVRPYTGKLGVMSVTEERWGGITRKLTTTDKPLTADLRLALVDGQHTADQYEVRKPNVVETRFYGGDTYSDFVTVYRSQIDMSLTSVTEFNRFVTMILTNLNDRREMAKEAARRTCLLNMIGITMSGEGGEKSAVNLLAEYNAETNLSLTLASVYEPNNFGEFAKWAVARMKYYMDLMAERNYVFHKNLDATNIPRHTPANMRKAVFKSDFVGQLNARVKSSIYNPDYLNIPEHSEVGYWQSIDNPEAIKVNATYMNGQGATANIDFDNEAETKISKKILGVVFDVDAAAHAMLNNEDWSAVNPRGGYSNIGYNSRNRWTNDPTENVIVFYMAEA